MGCSAFGVGVDLNRAPKSGVASFWGTPKQGSDEHRQDPVRPTHGPPTVDIVHPHCGAVWRRPIREAPAMHRAIPGHGVRATDVPGGLAGHRSLLDGADLKALSRGLPWPCEAFDLGGRQRIARLAYPCGVRPGPDQAGPGAVRLGEVGGGPGGGHLRLGLHHDRPVPFAVPMGIVPKDEGCREDAHPAGPSGGISRVSSTSATGSGTTSTYWTCWFRKRARST